MRCMSPKPMPRDSVSSTAMWCGSTDDGSIVEAPVLVQPGQAARHRRADAGLWPHRGRRASATASASTSIRLRAPRQPGRIDNVDAQPHRPQAADPLARSISSR